ncbi:MAG: hypothetical protein SAJ72_24395, partial [Jaaginema sp. PMC 1080.18]|nr:hypothetical protein [Jaaginema sp. PMC 1080.18]
MNYRTISSFLVFFSAAMTFALPSKAGSIASVRVITTTNWYTCSTGKSLEATELQSPGAFFRDNNVDH